MGFRCMSHGFLDIMVHVATFSVAVTELAVSLMHAIGPGTLFRALIGLYRPPSGHVMLGKDKTQTCVIMILKQEMHVKTGQV